MFELLGKIFLGTVAIILIFWGAYKLQTHTEAVLDRDCKAKFGQEWSGRYVSKGADLCVNGSGEAKYL